MLIVITGCDGSGKSTVVRWLTQELSAQGCKVHVVDTWALNQPDRYPECKFLSNDVREIKQCGTAMRSPERTLFLLWMIAQAASTIRSANPDDIFIADGYWPKHAASEVESGFPEFLVREVVHLLPQPDLTVLLDIDPQTALHRKCGQFTPYECGSVIAPSPQAFLDFQSRIRKRLARWATEDDWVSIDTSNSRHVVCSAILNLIQERLINTNFEQHILLSDALDLTPNSASMAAALASRGLHMETTTVL
jgi:dTMP kinase